VSKELASSIKSKDVPEERKLWRETPRLARAAKCERQLAHIHSAIVEIWKRRCIARACPHALAQQYVNVKETDMEL
jgi:hypothetical protein